MKNGWLTSSPRSPPWPPQPPRPRSVKSAFTQRRSRRAGPRPRPRSGEQGVHLEEPTCPSNSVPEAPTEPQRPLKRKATETSAPLAGRSWGSGGTELGAELGGQVLLRDHAEQPRTKPWHRALDETDRRKRRSSLRGAVLHPKGWEATEAGLNREASLLH